MRPTTWDHWLYVSVPFLLYVYIVFFLVVMGEHGAERNPFKVFFRRISTSLERFTGYPGWAMAGALSGLTMLGVAMVGLYWDVAYHIDVGRDDVLFTPSHTMIVLGLGGLVYSAVVAVIFATLDRAPVGFRVFGLWVPWSALTLATLGIGGVAGFPLDNLWHQAYGVDVTLWSPTHLQLVAGGALATIPVWLMLLEGRAGWSRSGKDVRSTLLGRGIQVLALGAILTGMSAFQGEFDFAAPQFQVSYFPILISLAAGFTLALARVALGPWGALKAVTAFLILRGCVALIVGVALNHTVPRFPLYVASALAVEVVGWLLGTERRLRFALVAGAAVGTVGLAGDLAWSELSGWFGDASGQLPAMALLALPAAMAMAVAGVALGRVVSGGTKIPVWMLAASGAVVLLALLLPLPRNVGSVEATIRLDRTDGLANIQVALDPPDAARDASAFAIMSWQGGGRFLAGLEETGPGRYESTRPLPVGGPWKTTLSLQRGDEVMAAPVYLPADPAIGAPEIPALAERRAPLVRNTKLLLREARPGPAWVAVSAYSGLSAVVALWVGLFALCALRIPHRREGAAEPPSPPDVRPSAWKASTPGQVLARS